ncbi:20374_t:CDS:2, partial [Gigaspora margarita]
MSSLQYKESPRNEELSMNKSSINEPSINDEPSINNKPKYLKLINLTEDEWQLLDNLIILIKLFYEAITIFSGSNYLIFNLIYTTIKQFIKKFESSDKQTEDNYADLLFGSREQKNLEYEHESPIILEQLQQLICASQGRKKSHKKTKKNKSKQYSDPRFKNHYLIELLVTTIELYDMKISDKVGLIASFLDPQIKNLNFIDDEDMKITTINTVQRLCLEKEHNQSLIEEILRNDEFDRFSNNLMSDLYSNEELNSVTKENEIDYYI